MKNNVETRVGTRIFFFNVKLLGEIHVYSTKNLTLHINSLKCVNTIIQSK